VPIGGTSAVAPLWAGLIALLNQQLGHPVGFLNPYLYQHAAQLGKNKALRDVTSGNNGLCRGGWELHRPRPPDGALLLQALRDAK